MRHTPSLGALIFCVVCLFGLADAMTHAQSTEPAVVISQVYGGGGNSGATYTHDFIELFNRSETPVSLMGWSVQYASATGAAWQKTALTGTIPPGGYYLIQQAQGSGGTLALPVPDAVGAIPMSSSKGKVALLRSDDLLSRGTVCPDGAILIDLVGFGSTSCFAGAAPAPALDNQMAGLRAGGGCGYSGDNGADFSAERPSPRNSTTPPAMCSGSAAIRPAAVNTPSRAEFTGTELTGTAQGPGSAAHLAVTIQPLTGTVQTLPHSVITRSVAPQGSVSATVMSSAHLVISQVYGGGGNAGATFTHDFIELYNPGGRAVAVNGWSVQYASATGKTWLVTPLSGTVPAGGFYLIQQAQGSGGSARLSAPDAVGEVAMSASSSKVALVQAVTPLTGSCPVGVAIVDFVGYGNANCFEGSGPGPRTSNTLSLRRIDEGSQDTDDNRADFATAPPTPRMSAP